MEVQITDYENAAFAVFIVLLTRLILAKHLNLYIPITKARLFVIAMTSSDFVQVDENLDRAQIRNAVLDQKFHFRRHLSGGTEAKPATDEYVELSVNAIINGEVGRCLVV